MCIYICCVECAALLRYMGVRARVVDFSSRAVSLAHVETTSSLNTYGAESVVGTRDTWQDVGNGIGKNGAESTPLVGDVDSDASSSFVLPSHSPEGTQDNTAGSRRGECVLLVRHCRHSAHLHVHSHSSHVIKFYAVSCSIAIVILYILDLECLHSHLCALPDSLLPYTEGSHVMESDGSDGSDFEEDWGEGGGTARKGSSGRVGRKGSGGSSCSSNSDRVSDSSGSKTCRPNRRRKRPLTYQGHIG